MKKFNQEVTYQVVSDATSLTVIGPAGKAIEVFGFNIAGVGVGQVVTVFNGAAEFAQLNFVAANNYRSDVISRGVVLANGCKIQASFAGRITAFYKVV